MSEQTLKSGDDHAKDVARRVSGLLHSVQKCANRKGVCRSCDGILHHAQELLAALSASGAGDQSRKFQSCQCPAAHGEPCPLTVDECAARVPGVPAAGLGDLSRSGLEVAPSAAERTTRQILCSECFDARGFNNVHGTFPQVYCDACGRLCMGYGTRPAAERT
jgi:hypothetical protein